MNGIIDILEKRVKKLNEIAHGVTEFYRLCRQEKVKVYEIPLRANIYGYYSTYRGKAYIILNSRMDSWQWLVVAYHELGHHFLHAPVASSMFFNSRYLSDRQEREAQAFALLAILPLPLLREIEENPSLLDDYPPDLIRQRLKLFADFGI